MKKFTTKFVVLGRSAEDAGRRGSGPSPTVLVGLLLGVAILSGCAGGGGTTTPPTPATPPTPPTPSVTVGISPATASVDQGGKRQFLANVTGSDNHAVTWSIQEGPTGGSIDQTGLYTAPTSEFAAHVVATSVADPSKSSSAVVSANAVGVWMRAVTGLPRGRQRQFTAYVSGTVIKDVSWTVEEGIGGTITSGGVYTAPTSGGPFHITARSVADPSKNATTEVVLTDAGFRWLSASMLSPRIWHTATLLPDGKVLIAGGSPCNAIGCSPSGALSSAEIFDPVTETFTATGSMSVARVGHTATLLDNGEVLITGGWSSSFDSTTAEVYNPSTGTFAPTGDMGKHRAEHSASLLPDGRLLVAGGWVLENDGHGSVSWVPTKTAEVYDPVRQTFTPVADMPTVFAAHTASVLPDGEVLMAGGSGGGCPGAQAAVAIFHPASNTFGPGPVLPKPSVLHAATTLNDGRVLFSGGSYDYCVWDTPSWDVAYDTAVVFDPATSSYSSAKVMRERRWDHSATLLADGKVLVVGSTADLFDPITSSFVITGDPYTASLEGFRTATRLSDGRVLFTGGSSSAEIYE